MWSLANKIVDALAIVWYAACAILMAYLAFHPLLPELKFFMLAAAGMSAFIGVVFAKDVFVSWRRL